MGHSEAVTIKVKRGVKVDVHEVDHLEDDRVLIAEAPKGLKIAVRQVPTEVGATSLSKITMCG